MKLRIHVDNIRGLRPIALLPCLSCLPTVTWVQVSHLHQAAAAVTCTAALPVHSTVNTFHLDLGSFLS